MYKYHILISIINKSPVKLTIIVYLAIKLGIIAAVGLFTGWLGELGKGSSFPNNLAPAFAIALKILRQQTVTANFQAPFPVILCAISALL